MARRSFARRLFGWARTAADLEASSQVRLAGAVGALKM